MKLKEISKELNISASTISRVLNNKSGVSEKNRKLINDYLDKKNLKYSDDNTIVIIVPNLENLHFCEVIKVINRDLMAKQYKVLIFDSNQNYDTESKIVSEVVKLRPKGVILCINDKLDSIKSLEILNSENISVVIFDRDLEYSNSGVFLNDFESGILAAQSLIKKNCKEILIIHDSMKFKNILNRLNGIKYLLEKYKISVIEVEEINKDNFKEKKNLISDILKNKNKIDGVIILNPSITLDTLELIKSNTFTLEEKNIVCYQLPKFISSMNKNINNITYSTKDMCNELSKLLLNKINNENSYINKIFVKPILT